MPIFQEYPPSDLLYALIDLYFRQVNDYTPLLHEFIFKKAVNSGLHLRDGEFGATVLLVCANGARFSSDTRVLLEGQDYHSAGWKWFMQVEEARRSLFSPAKLYDLQVYVVRLTILQTSIVLTAAQQLYSSCSYSCKAPTSCKRHGCSSGQQFAQSWTLVHTEGICTVQDRGSRRSFGSVQSGMFLLLCFNGSPVSTRMLSILMDDQDFSDCGLVLIVWTREDAMH